MDPRWELAPETIDKLKCLICEKHLSVPPVTIISKDGELKCGRCQSVPTELNIRNRSFELMASYFQFPCVYDECEEKLKWGSVDEHEEVCMHRCIRCPIFWQCEEFHVKINSLRGHFDQYHPSLLFYDTATIKLTGQGTIPILLLIHEGQQYLIYSMGITSLAVVVFSLNPSFDNRVKYEVKLSADNSNRNHDFVYSSLVYSKRKINKFKGGGPCSHCFKGLCRVKSHKLSQGQDLNTKALFLESLNPLKLNIDTIGSVLHSKIINCAINLTSDHLEAVEDNPRDNLHEIRNILRNTLECPLCQEYMRPPIFNCQTGHVICNACKANVEACPMCRNTIRDCRSFALEELSRTIKVPCLYESKGCKVNDRIDLIGQHEDVCPYKSNELFQIKKIKLRLALPDAPDAKRAKVSKRINYQVVKENQCSMSGSSNDDSTADTIDVALLEAGPSTSHSSVVPI